MPYLLVICL